MADTLLPVGPQPPVNVTGVGATVPTEQSWKLPFIQEQQAQQGGQQAPSGEGGGGVLPHRQHGQRMQQSEYTAPWLFGAIYGAVRHQKITQVRDYVVKWNTLMDTRDNLQEMMLANPKFQGLPPEEQQKQIDQMWQKTPEFQHILVDDPKAAKDMFKALHVDFLNPKENVAQQALIKALQLRGAKKNIKNLAQLRQQYASGLAGSMPMAPERVPPQVEASAKLAAAKTPSEVARNLAMASAEKSRALLYDAQRQILQGGGGAWEPVIQAGQFTGIKNPQTKKFIPSTADPKSVPPDAAEAMKAGEQAMRNKVQEERDKEKRLFQQRVQASTIAFNRSMQMADYRNATKQISTAQNTMEGVKVGDALMHKLAPKAQAGNQQAMVAILSTHVQMTLGRKVVPGSTPRISQFMYEEAMQSSDFLARIASRIDWSKGYLTGVTLTPEQITQMVDMADDLYSTTKMGYNDMVQQYGSAMQVNPRQRGERPAKKPDLVIDLSE